MSRWMRWYYYGVFGAIGGLISWQISNVMGLSFSQNIFVSEMIVGAMIGLSIGFLVGGAEGFITRNFLKATRDGMMSGFLGLIGGGIGLPLAEGIFLLIGGQAIARALGWGFFGMVIGFTSAFTAGGQRWKGALGGALGGILGGFFLEAGRQWMTSTLLGKAAGLLLMGASVGAFIAMIVFMLSRAWLEVISGKLKGTEFILDKFLRVGGPSAIIGSDSLKADIVLPDPDIAPQHAILQGAGTHFNVKDISLTGTYINGQKIEQAPLRNRQKIHMGNTELRYNEKR